MITYTYNNFTITYRKIILGGKEQFTWSIDPAEFDVQRDIFAYCKGFRDNSIRRYIEPLYDKKAMYKFGLMSIDRMLKWGTQGGLYFICPDKFFYCDESGVCKVCFSSPNILKKK